MNSSIRLTLLLSGLLLATSAGAEIHLLADFEGLPLNECVPLGGAALGQPTDQFDCDTFVRNGPLDGQCLEIRDNDTYYAGSVNFEFVDTAEITSGTLQISCLLQFDSLDQFSVGVREPGGATRDFTSLFFLEAGYFVVSDELGYPGAGADYLVGEPNVLRLVFDMDLRTYDVWFNGSLVLDDRAHGVTDRGIGSVYCGLGPDADLDGILWLDNLTVNTDVTTAAARATWSEVKRTWR